MWFCVMGSAVLRWLCVWLDDDDGAMQNVSISSLSLSTVKGNDIDLGDAIEGLLRVDAGSW